jgi:ketosteroid isomerase-like protein
MTASLKANPAASPDLERLLALNAEYIRSVQQSDAATFRQMLAPDFLCTHADGSFVDREEFLRQVAAPAKISNLAAQDVLVRIDGDFAVVHGRTTFTRPDGGAGEGRYTDIYARRGGKWLAIAAHVTRR